MIYFLSYKSILTSYLRFRPRKSLKNDFEIDNLTISEFSNEGNFQKQKNGNFSCLSSLHHNQSPQYHFWLIIFTFSTTKLDEPPSDSLQLIFWLQNFVSYFFWFSFVFKFLRSFSILDLEYFLSSSCNCRKVNVMFALSKWANARISIH